MNTKLQKINFEKESLIKAFYNSQLLLAEFERTLLGLSNFKKNKKIRVYIENSIRDDFAYLLQNHIFPKNTYNINQYFKNFFSSDNYCLAISQLEKYSSVISTFFSTEIIKNWNSIVGNQVMGFELYSFLGEYNTTPFGIHKDLEDTILFHLGPNPVKIYCWHESLDLNGQDIYNFQHFNNKYASTSYELHPGDLFIIPKNIPHLVTRIEFSITLGAIPYPINSRWLLERFFKSEFENKLIKMNPPNSYKEGKELQLIDLLGSSLNEIFHSIDFKEKLRDELDRLKSNGWLINPSILPYNNLSDVISIADDKDFIVRTDGLFINFFASGKHLRMRNIPPMKNLGEKILETRRISFEDFSRILSSDFDNNSIEKLYLIFKNLNN